MNPPQFEVYRVASGPEGWAWRLRDGNDIIAYSPIGQKWTHLQCKQALAHVIAILYPTSAPQVIVDPGHQVWTAGKFVAKFLDTPDGLW